MKNKLKIVDVSLLSNYLGKWLTVVVAMIVIGGASNSYQEGMGAFQEAPQVESARLYTKWTARPDSPPATAAPPSPNPIA